MDTRPLSNMSLLNIFLWDNFNQGMACVVTEYDSSLVCMGAIPVTSLNVCLAWSDMWVAMASVCISVSTTVYNDVSTDGYSKPSTLSGTLVTLNNHLINK